MSPAKDDTTAGREQTTQPVGQPAEGEAVAPKPMPPRVGRREPYDTGETLPIESRKHGALEAPPRLSGEQQRRARRRRSILVVLGTVAAFAAVAALAVTVVWVRGLEARFRFPTSAVEPIDNALTTANSAEETYTVLALGVDASPALQSQQLRAIMLFRVTPSRVTALSIAPDIAVRPQIPQSPTVIATQTAEAAALGKVAEVGGLPAVIDTVERALGVPVNHLMIIDLSALSRLADGVGGVWVNVPTAINDPLMKSLGGAVRVDAGRQLLAGDKAVTLVRALPDSVSQTDRMARQRLFVGALAKALAAENPRLLAARVARWTAGGILSDMSSRELQRFLSTVVSSAPRIESASLWGNGESELKDLDPHVAARLVSAFMSGADLAKASPKPPRQKAAATVTVSVRNGSGTSGLAAQAASILKSQGFRVRAVGNADQFVYDETLIIYKSNARSGADRVAKSLPVGRLVPSRGMYAFDTAVLVVVGKDWETASPKSDPVPVRP